MSQHKQMLYLHGQWYDTKITVHNMDLDSNIQTRTAIIENIQEFYNSMKRLPMAGEVLNVITHQFSVLDKYTLSPSQNNGSPLIAYLLNKNHDSKQSIS